MKNPFLSRGAASAFVSFATIIRWTGPTALCGLGVVALVGCGGGSGGGISPLAPTPTTTATVRPTITATAKPTTGPTTKPTTGPTGAPTTKPTTKPTTGPTAKPTIKPTAGPTAKPTTKPTTGPTAKPTTKPTVAPTVKPTTRPTVTPTTKPTATPTVKPTTKPTPTATPSGTNGPVTVFFSTGNVNGGQYVQIFGQFMRYKLVPLGPTPTPEPTTGPVPTPIPSTFYLGTYKLSNQETGSFFLVDQTDPDEFDSASGSPNIPNNKTFDTMPIAQGAATITGKVSGSSGSGTIKLSDGVTGTFTITSRVVSSKFLKKFRSLNPLVK